MADFVFHEIEKHKITGPSGEIEVAFNPTDVFFLERVYDACEKIAAKADEREREPEPTGNANRWETYHRFDEEVRAVLDELLNAPVCDTCFSGCWMFAYNGDVPLWLSIVLWIADEMYDAGMSAENRAMRRIRQYENKYTKRYTKKK